MKLISRRRRFPSTLLRRARLQKRDIAEVQVPAGIIPFEVLDHAAKMASIFSKIVVRTSRATASRKTTSSSPSSTFSSSRRGTPSIPKGGRLLFDLDGGPLSRINLFARDVAKQIERAIPRQRVGGGRNRVEVPHAHVHLILLQSVSDINFERPKLDVTQEPAATAERIRTS